MSIQPSITLTDHFNQFIAEQVQAGHYATPSDVVRAALQLLEIESAKLVNLRKILKESEASGFVDYSLEELLQELDGESA